MTDIQDNDSINTNADTIIDQNTNTETIIDQNTNEIENKENSMTSENTELKSQIEKLNKELSQSQFRYIELYNNYKIIEKLHDDQKKNEKKDKIFFAVKDMSQIINNLYNFINSLPQDLINNESIKGLTISYNNYIKSLESKNIYIVKSLGEMPNEMHDVIAIQEATDYDKKILTANDILIDNLTGKIINQFEIGFYYDNNGQKELIKSAKVIVGS